AYQLISVSEQFGESKLSLLSHFADTALRLLAAPSVPQEVRETALRHAEAGETMTVRQAKALIEANLARQRAEAATQHAQQEAERAHQRLREKEAEAQAEIDRLTHRLMVLTQEMAALSIPEVEIREVEKVV